MQYHVIVVIVVSVIVVSVSGGKQLMEEQGYIYMITSIPYIGVK